MDWDSLSDVDLDDDDEAFFESHSRLSTAVPLSPASSSDEDYDDEKFDDPRTSFVSAVSSVQPEKTRVPSPTDSGPDYAIWMAAPTSINERRKRLLHGMGLDDDKQLSKALSVRHKEHPEKRAALLVTSTKPAAAANVSAEKEKTEHSSVHLVPVRSRSEGDIESFSPERSRKEDFIGKVSKQRLTRTATAVGFPRARSRRGNRAVVRKSNEMAAAAAAKRSVAKPEETGGGALFLIKNLDTGKKFIVNEYGENGMWNRLSDLQTGKQLTMEEFERTVGKSRVVNELMKRGKSQRKLSSSSYISRSLRLSKKRGVAFLKNIKGVASGFIGEQHPQQQQQVLDQWVRVRQSGKSHKELSALHLCQELQAHEGCVWTIKFSFDGRYLATAGEDTVIRLWEVHESEFMSLRPDDGTLSPLHPSMLLSNDLSPMASEKHKKKGKFGIKRGPSVPEYVHVPETVFSLSEKPCCSLRAHTDHVLDLAWSKSHQVRIWSISERQVVNWIDIHEMVTAVSYTPDGQFAPGKPSEVLVTSADSRIRILDGSEVVQKYRGFRNGNSQIAATFSPDGRYIISASEDSQVYMWKHEEANKSGGSGKGRNVLVTRSHEHFQCKDVSVAIAWPCTIRGDPPVVPLQHSNRHSKHYNSGEDTGSPCCAHSKRTLPPLPSKKYCDSPKEFDSFARSSKRNHLASSPTIANGRSPEEEEPEAISRTDSGTSDSFSSSASWSSSYSLLESGHVSSAIIPSAWGLVIVTAGFGGEIRCYQNFGLPRKTGMQPNIFGGHNSFSHANT
ncbi:hypothetical protein Fmac_028322 [Flemingia macrophylla]|uniref:Uncharacterized protein n=1 Tax=Flemingia macrophylla TaxID=520843 RepID=A0ABD1L7K9_9FABA